MKAILKAFSNLNKSMILGMAMMNLFFKKTYPPFSLIYPFWL